MKEHIKMVIEPEKDVFFLHNIILGDLPAQKNVHK